MARDMVLSASPAPGKLTNSHRGRRQWEANTHWQVANRLQLCCQIIMAIKFCKNTTFLFETSMKTQYLIFTTPPYLGLFFSLELKTKTQKRRKYTFFFTKHHIDFSKSLHIYPDTVQILCPDVKNFGKPWSISPYDTGIIQRRNQGNLWHSFMY